MKKKRNIMNTAALKSSKRDSGKQKALPVKLTKKGNVLYQFTPVTEEERAKLRVDVYSYIL